MVTILIAVRALRTSRVRAALTAAGIAVGIAAVICTVSIGEGGAESIRRQLDGLGEAVISISQGSRNLGGVRTGSGGARTLTAEDASALAESVPGIRACSPQLTGRTQVIAGNRNWNTRFAAVTPEYFAMMGWRVAAGTIFTKDDLTRRARVVVLGANVADELRGDDLSYPTEIRIGRFIYSVIGILQPRGARVGLNQDDVVVVPYHTARRLLDNRPWVDEIVCSATSVASMPFAEEGIVNLLRERHELLEDDEDDFTLQHPLDRINIRLGAAETMTNMIAGLAAIALLVGGIGVMNIMLVSVTERTTEIGLRLAIGARASAIQWQFLVEAMMLGLAGGLAGVALGVASAHIITRALELPMLVSPESIWLGMLASAGTGLVFGYFPARHAAQLEPLVALRTET